MLCDRSREGKDGGGADDGDLVACSGRRGKGGGKSRYHDDIQLFSGEYLSFGVRDCGDNFSDAVDPRRFVPFLLQYWSYRNLLTSGFSIRPRWKTGLTPNCR
jgi:hypothetical protein